MGLIGEINLTCWLTARADIKVFEVVWRFFDGKSARWSTLRASKTLICIGLSSLIICHQHRLLAWLECLSTVSKVSFWFSKHTLISPLHSSCLFWHQDSLFFNNVPSSLTLLKILMTEVAEINIFFRKARLFCLSLARSGFTSFKFSSKSDRVFFL